MSLKVIGAGFGRTGTKSLQAALEQLGFAPCYHMTEVIKDSSHVDLWYAASRGEPVQWERIFKDYQATVDWPGCMFYRELMQTYPHAKVLLSVRDPERWYESTYNTLYQMPQQVRGLEPVAALIPQIKRMRRMIFGVIWNGTFDGRFDDKQHAINVFNEHIEAVKRTVPAEHLLVYSVKEGWEPLCAFLDVPVPESSFPHLNERDQFKAMMRDTIRPQQQRMLRRLGLAAAVVGLVLLAWRRIQS